MKVDCTGQLAIEKVRRLPGMLSCFTMKKSSTYPKTVGPQKQRVGQTKVRWQNVHRTHEKRGDVLADPGGQGREEELCPETGERLRILLSPSSTAWVRKRRAHKLGRVSSKQWAVLRNQG